MKVFRAILVLAALMTGALCAEGGPGGADALGDALPDGAIARLGTQRLWQGGYPVTALSFSADGKRLFSTGGTSILIWDAATGKALGRLPGEGQYWYPCLAVSANDRFAAAGNHKGQVAIWDVSAGRLLKQIQAHDSPVHWVALPPNGRSVVSVGTKKDLAWWDSRTGLPLRRIGPFDVAAMTLSGNGQVLALARDDRDEIVLMDFATAKVLRRLVGTVGKTISLALAHDGKTLAAGNAAGEVLLFDAGTGGRLATLDIGGGEVRYVSFSRDAKALATVTVDGKVHVWDVGSGKPAREIPTVGSNAYLRPAFSPDSRRLAYSRLGGRVSVWDLAAGKPAIVFPGHEHQLLTARFSPDGRTIATAGADAKVCLWRASDGGAIRQFPSGLKQVNALAFRPGGKALAVAGAADGRVLLLDVADGKKLGEYAAERCTKVFFFGQQVLAAYTLGRKLRSWQLPDGARVEMIDTSILSGTVAASADGRRVVIAGLDRQSIRGWRDRDGRMHEPPQSPRDSTVEIWDGKTGRRLGKWSVKYPGPGALAIVGDKGLLAVVSGGGVTVRNLADGKLLWAAAIDVRPHSVAGDAEGRLLAVGYDNGIVRVYDARNGRQIATRQAHIGRVWDLNFSPDAALLGSAGDDTTAVLWNVAKLTRAK